MEAPIQIIIKKVMEILFKSSGNKFILKEFEINYLGFFLIRYFNQINSELNLNNEDFNISLSDKNLNLLSNYFCEALDIAIEEFYEKPSEKHIQKHHSRYEKFIHKGVKYTVYITFIGMPRLIWVLNNLLVSIKEEMNNVGIIKISHSRGSVSN